MNCREVNEFSSDYLDQRLAPAQAAALQQHVRICSDCARELEELRATVAAIGSLNEVETSPDFLAEVNEKIDGGWNLARLRGWFFEPIKIKLPLEAAALLVVTTLALYVYHRSPELSQDGAMLFQEKALVAKQESGKKAPGRSVQPPASKQTPAFESQELREAVRGMQPLLPEPLGDKAAAPEAGAPVRRDTPQLSAALKEDAAPPASAARGPAPVASPMPLERAMQSRQATAQARIFPLPQKVLEVASEDTGFLGIRMKAILPELGGRVVSEQISDEGVVATIELPYSREAEFRRALKKEAGAEAVEVDAAPKPATGALSAFRRSQGQVEKSALKQEETVVIELRIRLKK